MIQNIHTADFMNENKNTTHISRNKKSQSNNWSIYIDICRVRIARGEQERHSTELAFNYALGSFQSTKRRQKFLSA